MRPAFRLILGALACAWLAFDSPAGAQDCPPSAFVVYDHIVYAGEPITPSASLAFGEELGDAVIDRQARDDPCKRKDATTVTAVRIQGVDPKVAVRIAGEPDLVFVVLGGCTGYVGEDRWRCLVEPVEYAGRRYTGVRYPGSDPDRSIPLGDPLGEAQLRGESVTAVRVQGVDPQIAIGLEGRPGEAYVAAGACPYERFAVEGALNDLGRCLRSPIWLVFDPQLGEPAQDVTVRGDRVARAELAGATVSLAPVTVVGDAVQADTAEAVEVGAIAIDQDGHVELQLPIPNLEPGNYEAVVTCEPCAAAFGGETVFPAGLFTVAGEPTDAEGSGGTSAFQIVGIVVGVLFFGLLITSIVLWRKGWRPRRKRRA